MLNFLLGTAAGAVIACVVTITAARHPEVQTRLGMIQAAHAALAPMPAAHLETRKPDIKCPIPAKTDAAPAGFGSADMLFDKRRFWFVTTVRK